MRYNWLFFIPPIIIAIIIFVTWYRYRLHSHDRDLKRVAVVAHTRTIKMLPAYRAAKRRYRLLLALAVVFFLASVFSFTAVAARPFSRQEHDTSVENRDIVLCLDISGSMWTYQAELLDNFKKIISGLHRQRISVTIFDGKPANLIPLSDDYDAVNEIIQHLSDSLTDKQSQGSIMSSIDFMMLTSGSSTSAIGDGVMGCVNSMDLSDSNPRAKSIIIATDNDYGKESQSIDIGQVARYAERYGITFYGIYLPGGTPVQKNEFIDAVNITGGSFYDIKDYHSSNSSPKSDDEKTISHMVNQIMSQDTAKVSGAPEIVYTDAPNTMLLISGISFVLFALTIWRLRL